LDADVQRVQIAVINKGEVPAYDVLYESWIEILTFPFEDFTSRLTIISLPTLWLYTPIIFHS
jgi:hypothetical protein